MAREREKFWEYVEDLNGRFRCKFCERTFAGGITRIKSHLSGVRGRDIEICSNVPGDVQFAALQAITANKKAKSLHQPDLGVVHRKDKSVVDKMLAKFIFSNQIPIFDFSKIPFLVDLMKSIAGFGPSYEFPSSSAYTSQLIFDVDDEVIEYTENVKNSFTKTGCTLILSNVVENSKLECINFFAYTPNGVLYVDNIAFPEEEMTFQHFTDSMCCIIEFLGPEHVVLCIFNNANEDIINGITDLDCSLLEALRGIIHRKYPWIYLAQCPARDSEGILTIFIYLSIPWVHKTTQLAKVIFKYLYKHHNSVLPRQEYTRKEEYNLTGLTKFAIELYMLISILEVEKGLQALQLPIASASCGWGVPDGEKDVTEVVDKAIHSTEFWRRGKKVVQMLQPLFQVIDFMDSNASTIGYLYEAMKRAEDTIKQHCHGNDQVHCEMVFLVFKSWRTRIINPIHLAAAFLNPAYMYKANRSEDSELQKGLDFLIQLTPYEEQETFLKQVRLYRMKVTDLFTDTAIKWLDNLHPWKWWEYFGGHYPILQKYAMRILSQTCTTALRKHCNFKPNGSFGELRMNLLLMEKFRSLASQNLEPIDFHRNSGLLQYAHKYLEGKFESLDWPEDIDYDDLLVIDSDE